MQELVAAVLGAAFDFAEHGNRTRIVAPDKLDSSATFVGTVNGAIGSRELGKRMINSERSPLF
jgi:methyl coenzyme M reductase subunit C